MYLKIVNESQLDLLKQMNKCLGKKKLPKEALQIIESRQKPTMGKGGAPYDEL